MIEWQRQYRMQNLQLEGTMPPQAMNPTIQSSPNSATRGSNDPTMHPRDLTNQGPTHAINGAANSNISQPPESSILGTPLNPRPIMNHQSVLTDSLFPPDFMQHLDDFDTSMFPGETDINF